MNLLKASSRRNHQGFTLIEILLVVVIIGILSVFSFIALTQVQKANRDTQRKSDLQGVVSALARFYSDNANFPASGANGKISYSNTCGSTATTDVNWGTGNIVCNSKSYMRQLPKDPLGDVEYCYSASAPFQTYTLYAHLEKGPASTLSCGGNNNAYNYQVKPTD